MERLPFYMTYPKELGWDEESIFRRDYNYMKNAYPDTVKRILPYVEEECDRLEYQGSMMFDEYPDQLQLRLLCGRIYHRLSENEKYQNQPIRELVQVLVYQEILKRRREYRKYRKIFY